MHTEKTLSRLVAATTAVGFIGTAMAPAYADTVVLKQGTPIKLAFDSYLNSKTAKVGQRVNYHVVEPVVVDGRTVIAAGTPEVGTVEKVDKRGRYGVNAHIRLDMAPIKSVMGTPIPIGFKTTGQDVSGKTGGAAAATIGGAALLGPIGLIGGLFVVGKSVNAKPGDKMTVTVDADQTLQAP
jgi:hypothetical protein